MNWRRANPRPAPGQITARSVVMLGDSLTAQADWSTLLPGHRLVNEGHLGHTTEELAALAPRIAAARPRGLVLMTGTNDIRDGRDPEWTIAHLARLLDGFDGTSSRIVVQSVLPRTPRPDAARAANEVIAAHVSARERVGFLDLHPHFDRGDGTLRDDETTDGIHLSPAGYRRWADLLQPTLLELLAD